MVGRDIGEEILAKNAILQTALLAAGTGDNTEINGDGINRSGLGSMYESCKLIITGVATVASGASITIAANLQDSADGSTWADYGDALATVTLLTGTSGGSEIQFETTLDNDLRGAKQYIRAQVLPDLSAGSTDTAIVGAALVFGGASEYPAT